MKTGFKVIDDVWCGMPSAASGTEVDGEEYLVLVFRNSEEYKRAKDWFKDDSDFFVEKENDEFKSLFFKVDGDVDETEKAIEQELNEEGFESYHFEGESAAKGKAIEKGAASILIELEKGNIVVKHGSDGEILHEVKNAEEGSWDKIWKTIKGLKSK